MASDIEFDAFVASRSPALLRTSYLLVRDLQLAEDLLQTSLTKAWFSWKRINGDPEPYVRRILVTTSVSWWRQRWTHETPTTAIAEIAMPDGAEGPAYGGEVWAALGRLPRRQRAVVVLRYVEDCTEAETADLLGCSIGTVKSQCHKALFKLRLDSRLATEDGEEPVVNIEDLTFLKEHVSTIDGHRTERLEEVHDRIRAARRRRVAVAVSGATALAAAVFVFTSVVPGPSENSAPPVDQPPPSETPIDEPAAHLPALPTSLLAPGTYQFSVIANPGAEIPDALVDVPVGFDGGGDRYVVSPDGYQFLGIWTVRQVERDACHRELNHSFTPGPSVEDLADALVAQKSTDASAPEPVSLAGHQGLYVELASPRDIRKCDQNPALWREPGERGIYDGGQVDMLWILDVDGQRLVVDAAYSRPESTGSDIDKLTSMVDSLEFEAAARD